MEISHEAFDFALCESELETTEQFESLYPRKRGLCKSDEKRRENWILGDRLESNEVRLITQMFLRA